MTDAFWFHICWNVESVTWPLWYRMIYRALTPVANVLARARGGLRCKWIVSIKSHSGPQQNGLRFHSEVFWPVTFALLVGSLSSNVNMLLFSQIEREKVWVKLHPHGYSVSSHWQCHLEEIRNFNRTSLSILVVHRFHAPIRQGLRQIQAGKNSRQSSLKSAQYASRTLPKCPALQNKVGWGHCLARYNYIVKLSLSLRHNGR